MTGITIEGGNLPPELGRMLAGALGGKHPNAEQWVPATLVDVRGLLEGSQQKPFNIGDLVSLRPHAANDYHWPREGDKCIVTQVLDQPYRSGGVSTGEPGKKADFAIAIKTPKGEVLEFLHDSRNFVKVGSIYDPIKLASGEEISVE